MNKQRRARLENLKERLEEILEQIDDIKSELEEVKDEEQEAYDNLPESIQYSDRGCNMEENISDLEYAYDSEDLQEIIDYIDGVIER